MNKLLIKWMAEADLYEEDSFYYFLIIFLVSLVGIFSFGFEISDYNLQQNLLFNFIWFLFLAVTMVYGLCWYRRIFGTKPRSQQRNYEIQQRIRQIRDLERQKLIQEHLGQGGSLAPRTSSKWSLIFLGWCILFEIFFVSAWVKNLTLIWQPIWIQWIIEFMTENLNLPPLHVERKFFILSVKNAELPQFFADEREFFADEREFLASPLANIALVFHFWRILIFFPVFIAFFLLLKEPGDNRFDPKNIRGFFDFILASIISFLMLFILIGFILVSLISVTFLWPAPFSSVMWFLNLYKNFGFIVAVIALKYLLAWFDFWKKNSFHV